MTRAAERDRIIALAAIMQVVALVQQIADTGQVNNDELKTLLNSLLMTDAPTTEAVYGELNALRTGFTQLNKQLSKNKDKRDVMLLRYVISLLHLERQLAKHPEMMEIISREIDQVPQQVDYFGGIDSSQVIARFADIYHRTISQLTPRIQVIGDPSFLQQPDNVNRVRALLLAGIRAAILWRQKGGRRWQFLFQTKRIMKLAESIRATL